MGSFLSAAPLMVKLMGFLLASLFSALACGGFVLVALSSSARRSFGGRKGLSSSSARRSFGGRKGLSSSSAAGSSGRTTTDAGAEGGAVVAGGGDDAVEVVDSGFLTFVGVHERLAK